MWHFLSQLIVTEILKKFVAHKGGRESIFGVGDATLAALRTHESRSLTHSLPELLAVTGAFLPI